MYRFVLFLKRIGYVFLFIVIEVIAFRYYSDSSGYNQARTLNIANNLTGNIYSAFADVRQYFYLGKENKRLTEEVAGLRAELSRYEDESRFFSDIILPESLAVYSYMTAKIINNSLNRAENFMTLNKGSRDGVKINSAVISDGAIAGYVMDCDNKFSVAISVLNTKFKTSGKLKGKNNSSGSVFWDAKHYDEMVFTEIPKYAEIAVGDTVITTEFSSRFPEGIHIGTVKSFELINGTYYEARLEIMAKMGGLNNVVLVYYNDMDEKISLEENYR
ncbi:MAG: rod shape-determining protein MreC [Rikenellaceae bacterium]|nr:rod shape-determining protein MreC [Rikenellaceae bacterium]